MDRAISSALEADIISQGSWGGAGMRKKPPKPQYVKKIAGIDPTTRADYNKKHIIISEKKDKKAAKYMVTDLPYPYSSQAQYEKAMERPLGVQWNTRTAFQRATLPRVVKKPGVVITPLEKMAQ
jgi:U3 small nucleolar RNA-associated protein 14